MKRQALNEQMSRIKGMMKSINESEYDFTTDNGTDETINDMNEQPETGDIPAGGSKIYLVALEMNQGVNDEIDLTPAKAFKDYKSAMDYRQQLEDSIQNNKIEVFIKEIELL